MTDRELMQMLAQPEPKPVLWRYKTVTFWNSNPQWRYLNSLEGTEGLLGLEPLYTTPPKREWVGLTDDEVMDIYVDTMAYDAVRAAEALLREKNT